MFTCSAKSLEGSITKANGLCIDVDESEEEEEDDDTSVKEEQMSSEHEEKGWNPSIGYLKDGPKLISQLIDFIQIDGKRVIFALRPLLEMGAIFSNAA